MKRASIIKNPGFLFRIRGRVDRITYAVVGFTLMAVKYAVDAGVIFSITGVLWTPLDYLNPILGLRLEKTPDASIWFHLAFALWALPFLWIGVAMTVRRAFDAGRSPLHGLWYFVPGINYLVMIGFCLLPSRGEQEWPAPSSGRGVDARLPSILLAVSLSLLCAVSLLLFFVYKLEGYGVSLFAGIPFLLGLTCSYLLNRKETQTLRRTLWVATLAQLIGFSFLLLFALEGIMCVAMALPIALPVTLLGAGLGRYFAALKTRPAFTGLMIVAVLPVLGTLEKTSQILPRFEVRTAIEIDAPPETVWNHVIQFPDLPPPTSPLFRLGISYPTGASIAGEGVGAIRECRFSTGSFIEPITSWDEPVRLSFDVVAEPPSMLEWSPYSEVRAPHLQGFFHSTRGEFRLIPLPDGRTRLEGSTWYQLDIHPQTYWRIWAETIVHRIHFRVLRHIKTLSEPSNVTG